MNARKSFGLKTAGNVQWAAVALALGACGGGGGDSTSTPPPVVVAPPAPGTLKVGGTAATGAALASAQVQIKCVAGNGVATTGPDGVYSVTIAGASLPCVLSASSGASTLRSVAEAGSGTTATVNITPLSEIIVARLAGGDAGSLFTHFDAAAQAKLSGTSLADARAAVAPALQGVIDLNGIDPIKDPLVAASAGQTGNALDQKLDSLGATLTAAQTSLPEVAAALAANPNALAVVQTLLQPAASGCAALHSGNFQALDPYSSSAPVTRVKVDAASLKVTDAKGSVKSWTSDSACAYSTDGGATKAYVAKSGIIVVRYPESSTVSRTMLLLPEQALPLAELAGTWNIAAYGADTAGGFTAPSFSVETLDASSKVTAGADCVGLAACTPWVPRASDVFAASAEGGYTQTDPEGTAARVFAVKNAAGQMAVVAMLLDAQKQPLGMAFLTKQNTLALPAVGQVENFWDIEVNYNGAKSPTDVQTTVKTVDATAQTYTRERASDGRTDGFAINQPRPGMRYREAGSSVNATGTTIVFGETLTTPLPGMGLTIYSSVSTGADNFFGISIAKP
jgi:hypothetical protein